MVTMYIISEISISRQGLYRENVRWDEVIAEAPQGTTEKVRDRLLIDDGGVRRLIFLRGGTAAKGSVGMIPTRPACA